MDSPMLSENPILVFCFVFLPYILGLIVIIALIVIAVELHKTNKAIRLLVEKQEQPAPQC